MGLSSAFLNAHIAEREQQLTGLTYPHRSKWPSRLFHHSPVENAVRILAGGALLSRNDSVQARARDVAAAEVIATRDKAHEFARLYFRPRTPTQYHIEGIRKAGECSFGDAAHAPVLIMFVFDARQVLGLDGVRFSDANMQASDATDDCTEEFFSKIPFDKVYHEGPHSDSTITKHRCAEVLAPSPMKLDGYLQWIYCRSQAERATLIHLLGESAPAWDKRVIVSDDLRVFEKRFAYVEHVSLANNGVIFQLTPRRDSLPINVKVQAWDAAGNRVVHLHADMNARPDDAEAWRAVATLVDGTYGVRVDLEGHLAYENVLTLGEIPF
jgi:hypothetical protein